MNGGQVGGFVATTRRLQLLALGLLTATCLASVASADVLTSVHDALPDGLQIMASNSICVGQTQYGCVVCIEYNDHQDLPVYRSGSGDTGTGIGPPSDLRSVEFGPYYGVWLKPGKNCSRGV